MQQVLARINNLIMKQYILNNVALESIFLVSEQCWYTRHFWYSQRAANNNNPKCMNISIARYERQQSWRLLDTKPGMSTCLAMAVLPDRSCIPDMTAPQMVSQGSLNRRVFTSRTTLCSLSWMTSQAKCPPRRC